MIEGKKINLRLYETEADCHFYSRERNIVTNRAPYDHRCIFSPGKLLKKFQETGLWDLNTGEMLITSKEDHILGDIGFTRRYPWEVEIGYGILRPENRGHGYMTESLKLFSSFLFDTNHDIARLRLQTTPGNLGSQRVAEKCGFKKEGLIRHGVFQNGQFDDFVVYGLLREECPGFEENM